MKNLYSKLRIRCEMMSFIGILNLSIFSAFSCISFCFIERSRDEHQSAKRWCIPIESSSQNLLRWKSLQVRQTWVNFEDASQPFLFTRGTIYITENEVFWIALFHLSFFLAHSASTIERNETKARNCQTFQAKLARKGGIRLLNLAGVSTLIYTYICLYNELSLIL